MDLKQQLVKALEKITGVEEVQLETPENEEFGDFTTNTALQLKGKKSPRQLAEELASNLKADKELFRVVDKVGVAGPGFINFWLKKNVLFENLIQIVGEKENYGKSDINEGKKVMVEFAHPNTHKAFHIGHLRNITTGESIVRLLKFTGTKVIRANYQGDVGMHIAKALWGIRQLGFNDPKDVKKRVEFLGKAYAEGATAYDENETAKEEIIQINRKIYSLADEEINKLYLETRKWSLDYFDTIYKRVGTHFDRLYFESECFENGKQYALDGLGKGILEKSQDAIIFPGKKYGLHDRVFITKEDTPTYEAKDMGLVKLQLKEFDPDVIIHVVGPEQSEYFKVVFKAQELLFPETMGRQLHVPYGWVRLKEGKMSSRTGKVILGEQLLDDAKNNIVIEYKSDEITAEKVAVGAVKYSFLKVGREQDIAFDLKESISLEGNSGPYLQYTFARTQSVISKSKSAKGQKGVGTTFKVGSLQGIYNNFELNPEELSLLRTFIRFPGIIINAAKNYSPNILCNYLFNLAQKFNTFYNMHGIIEDKSVGVEDRESVRNFRLALTSATGQILRTGLELLGIEAPKKM